jgi:hypothetical protein
MDREILIRLSLAQAQKLSETLWDARDEGPYGEGWASGELQSLRSLVDQAIEDHGKA